MNLKNNKLEKRFVMHFCTYLFFCLLHDHYVQKLSGTEIATVKDLPGFSSWLSVDQLHIPEEQESW